MKRSLATVATAALVAACASEAPVGPGSRPALDVVVADTGSIAASVELGSCGYLAAPEGSVLTLKAYASGVQIYRWTGTNWQFDAPSATLYGDAGFQGVIGSHYRGPYWQSVSGSKVKAASIRTPCVADPNSIPWLLLGAVSNEGPGFFEQTAYIQRVNTTGGKAPTTPGTTVGEEAHIPYTAVYLFYQAQ